MEGITQASEPRLYLRDLPADMVFDILLKLPVKSLLRYRCVSKVLCNIIDSPYFANKHHLSTHTAAEEPEFMQVYSPGMKVPMANKYLILLEFSRRKGYYTHYLSYGLFCCHNGGYRGNAILFNPLRGEVMILPQATVSTIPDAAGEVEWYDLGFDGTTDTYKIIRLFFQHQVTYEHVVYQKLAAEVYTLGTKSWRPISSGGPPCTVSSEGVSVNGDVHWLSIWIYPQEYAEGMINSHRFTPKNKKIISFDSRKEEFNGTPHPDYEDQDYQYVHLLNLRGSLAMVGVLSLQDFDIWVMKDYDRKEWAREYRVSIEFLAREPTNPIKIVGAWEHGLCFDDFCLQNIYLYNLKTDCMRSVSYPLPKVAGRQSRNIVSYTMTLVSLKNYGHTVGAEELGPGFSYVLNRADLVYIIP